MKKSIVIYEIFLVALILATILYGVAFFICITHTDGTLQEGLQAIFALIFGFIPLIIFAAACVALCAVGLFLFFKERKKGSVIASLVILCIMVLAAGFSATCSIMLIEDLFFLLSAILFLAILAGTFVFACVLTHKLRRGDAEVS